MPEHGESIRDAIEQSAAAGVEQVRLSDGTAATQLPIEQQIAADRHLAANRAARQPLAGVRLSQILPGRSL